MMITIVFVISKLCVKRIIMMFFMALLHWKKFCYINWKSGDLTFNMFGKG